MSRRPSSSAATTPSDAAVRPWEHQAATQPRSRDDADLDRSDGAGIGALASSTEPTLAWLTFESGIELRTEAPVKTFVARLFGVHTDERAFRVGADGEEEVAWRMRKLGVEWHVIHSVPVGAQGSDIDHVVIGPGGVFTLNTKNHTGKKVWVADKAFMVSGHKTNYLRNSRHEAARASKLLTAACGFEVQVEPIIVVMAAELTIKAQPPAVHVVAPKRIGKWLERRPPKLSLAAVDAIYEMARRDTTWRPA